MYDSESLHHAVNMADIINADGMGIVWASRVLGSKVPERVTGIDLFVDLLELANEKDLKVAFVGATAEVLEDLCRYVKDEFPNVDIVRAIDGYFEDEGVVVESIRSANPTMLFVGMPTPRKEMFLACNKQDLNVPFLMGVGGSFDVLAGKTRRAPLWMQKTGLEWFFRVLQEPRRLWRRYVFTNVRFARLVARELVRSRRSQAV